LSDTALLTVAQALHRGQANSNGCQANYAEAIRLYNLAASKGNLSAKRMLSLIYSKPGVNGDLNIAWMQQLANLNAADLSLSIDGTSLAPMLKREPTPLFDLIPQNLRNLANTQKP
jgi:TPR repeat protein